MPPCGFKKKIIAQKNVRGKGFVPPAVAGRGWAIMGVARTLVPGGDPCPVAASIARVFGGAPATGVNARVNARVNAGVNAGSNAMVNASKGRGTPGKGGHACRGAEPRARPAAPRAFPAFRKNLTFMTGVE